MIIFPKLFNQMILGKNIIIRPLEERDLTHFFYLQNSLIIKGELLFAEENSEHLFKKKFLASGFWQKKEGIAVIIKEEEIFGAVYYRLHPFFDAYELQYAIFNPENRGKGYMSEALKLFTEHLFLTRNIPRIQLSIPDYHRASISVAQKCGFQFEGIMRSAVFSRGKYIDLCIYALLR